MSAILVSAQGFLNSFQGQFNIGNAESANTEKTVSDGGVFVGDARFRNMVLEKREIAQKNAMKIMADAFDKEKHLDERQQEIREHVKKLSEENKGLRKEMKENDEAVSRLAEEYGVDPDSEEQKELDLLQKKSLILSGQSRETLAKEEWDKASRLEAEGLTEYQQRAVEYFKRNENLYRQVSNNTELIKGNNSALEDMKIQRLKTHPMLDAEKAADAVRKAAGEEILGMIAQGGMEHVEDELEEKKEKAKEKKEEKEEEQEKIDSVREKKAQMEEMAKKVNTQDVRSEIQAKREERKKEEAIMDILEGESEMEQISSKTTPDAAQAQAASEIRNILTKLGLLEEDIKGAAVDAVR